MFLGHYDHSIDEKGRVTLPARYREQLQGGAFLTKGFDNNLVLYTPARFTAFLERLNHINNIDPAARTLRRLLLSNAAEIEFDRNGRFILPQNLREVAHLDSTVVVVGVGEEIEFWSPELWKQQEELSENPDFTNQQFASLDLSI